MIQIEVGDKCIFKHEGDTIECEVMYIDNQTKESVVYIETDGFKGHCGRLHVVELKDMELNYLSDNESMTSLERTLLIWPQIPDYTQSEATIDDLRDSM